MVTFEQAKTYMTSHGMILTQSLYRQLQCYLEKLTQTNQYMNLTAITEPSEVWMKHFLDSAMLLQKVPLALGASVVDVGTGAGFPGMVLAILRPDLQILLLDTLQKRVQFLEETAALLGLNGVRCLHARAEEAGKNAAYREQFDLATARAVASMPVLTEYCMPFVKLGGLFAAMKGPAESAEDARAAAEVMGGDIPTEICYTLEGVGERKLICIRKHTATPEKYPRRSDKIRKEPIH